MSASLEIAVATYGPDPFKLINEIVRNSGHRTVALAYSRSMRPTQPTSPHALGMIPKITEVSGRAIRVRESGREPVDGTLRAPCGDGALWMTDWEGA